jgi:DNA-binding NtrC family response regulator
MLEAEGHKVEPARSADEGIASVLKKEFDVVVTDYQMPGSDGLEVVKTLHDTNPHLPVILMTAYHTTERVIEATKLGAYDYVLKPIVDPSDFFIKIEKAVESRRLMTKPVEIRAVDPGTDLITPGKDIIIGKSAVMLDVYKEIGRLAAKPVTVLIRGETGTGKELVARALYHQSDRKDHPFIVINCAAVPENLLESEFFGHEAGAFTDAKVRRIGKFEQANRGTIFLDEIGDMNVNLQQKLLRVLQDRTIQRIGGKETIPVDVRVLAATHRDLEQAIQEKTFRTDLYYRLSVALIRLPPLRDRREDIPDLVGYFTRRYAAELGVVKPIITEDAFAFLQTQPWPGNVRELENAVRRTLVLAGNYAINLEVVTKALAQTTVIEQVIQKYKHADIPVEGQGRSAEPSRQEDRPFAQHVGELLDKARRGELENVQALLTEQMERELFEQAIRLAGGNQSQAARWLGVSLPTMREKLTRYGLHPTKSEG